MLNFTTFEVVILFFFSIFVFLYYLSKIKHNALERTGIKHLEPSLVFGNLFRTLTGREHLSTTIKKIYDLFPDEKYVAIFEFMNPTIVLKDPELIKKVMIKDFNHFIDIPVQIDEHNDPVFGRILLTLKGLKWRQMRSAITPAFTSFKMKNMFNFIMDCAARGISYHEKKVEEMPKNYEFDVKDLASRFTTDVIASTAFGFDVDSLKDPGNKFLTEAMKLTSTNIWMMLKFTGFRVFPKLMKVLKIRLMPESTVGYFRKLIHNSLQEREELAIYRTDMLHLLLEAKRGSLEHELEEEAPTHFDSPNELTPKSKEKKLEWTDDDLVAQAIVFIIAGQQTTSTVFSFLIYELAVNSDVQDRLSEEVSEVMATSNGKLTYKTLLEMEYLDMVLSECLRKWAPIPFSNRLCVRDYDLGPVREGSSDHVEVKKGETVWIPVHSIHMDPLLWPNPENFDPERFSKDNIPNIKPQSFLPFGLGPRNCIGSRFALLNLKVMLFHYIWKFRFEPCSRTVIPPRISSTTLLIESRDGYWVSMKPRIQ